MIYFFINLKILRIFRYKLYRDTWRNIRNLSRSGLIDEIRNLLYQIHKIEIYHKPISKNIWNNKISIKKNKKYLKMSNIKFFKFRFSKNISFIFSTTVIWL